MAITAATGMGGIGKTDLAWHYAEQHQADYAAGIWWIAVDQLVVKVLEYALRMELPPPPEQFDEAAKVQWCYQKWAEAIPNGARLIVWDDVGDAEAYRCLQPFLPTDDRFRLLITTRANLPEVQQLPLETLPPLAAYQLLYEQIHFNREKAVGIDRRILEEQTEAGALCEWLGDLPLAIRVVSSFLNAEPDLSFAEMQRRLQAETVQNEALLPVEAAFSLSWAKLNPAEQQLAKLLGLFALAPIPWELVEAAVEHCRQLPPPRNFWQRLFSKAVEPEQWCLLLEGRALEQARRQLVSLSLLSRVGNEQYLLHALMRQFFAAKLEPEADELRQGFAVAMTEVAKTIPQTVTLEVIAKVKAAIPHLEAATAYTSLISDEDCDSLHIGTVWFYQGQSLWQEAEHWLKACREMTIDRFGEKHFATATSLNNLALLYSSQGRYGEAEPLYLQALDITRSQLGPDYPITALSLNNLAALYRAQGRYGEAEPLYLQALDITRSQLDPDHPITALSLNNLALLYSSQGRYGEAEPLYLQALDITRSQLGPDHPDTALSLNNLAALYESQGRYSEAEPLYLQALDITRSQLGPDHPNTAASLNNLALLYRAQGRYSKAEPLYEQALVITRSQLGQDHPSTALSLNNLAELYRSQGRYSEAEPLYLQALDIKRSQLGLDHPDTASSLNNLAALYYAQGRYSEAELLYLQALDIRRSQLGAEHPDIAASLNNLAELYRAQGRYSEAEPLYLQALNITRSQLGAKHPNTASSLNNLAGLYRAQGRYSEAELLYLQALNITRSQLGAEHPDIAASLNNLAGLYDAQGRYSKAELLYLQTLVIVMQTLGENHPNTQTVQRNFRYLLQQAVEAGQTAELSDHPITQDILAQLQTPTQ